MKIIQPSVQILTKDFENILKNIEVAGRVCYKSEDKITTDSATKFVGKLI
jgi:thymidylate synthase (FAD)